MLKKLITGGQSVKRYCQKCRKYTKTTITEIGAWETWYCHGCGSKSQYKVK